MMMQETKCKCAQEIRDHGPKPLIVDIDCVSAENKTFRTALWTGTYLQVTLMSIPVGGDVGLEVHEATDQFLRIEQGRAVVCFGKTKDTVKEAGCVDEHGAIVVPAGTWHNIVNCGNVPLKLYSIYAPPHHPFGTVHCTQADAEAADRADNARCCSCRKCRDCQGEAMYAQQNEGGEEYRPACCPGEYAQE